LKKINKSDHDIEEVKAVGYTCIYVYTYKRTFRAYVHVYVYNMNTWCIIE
jgi:hypothetical protein